MRRIESLAWAILHNEGFASTSPAWNWNNPGDLRYSPHQMGQENGFATFASFADGWDALILDLWLKCTGRTKTSLTPNSTLLNFAEVYAPYSDSNDSALYAQRLADQMGITIDTPLHWFADDIEDSIHVQ